MYVSLSNMSLLGTMLSYLGISKALRFLMSMESIARTEKKKKNNLEKTVRYESEDLSKSEAQS